MKASETILIVTLMICAFTDLRFRRIYNAVVLPAFLTGIVLRLVLHPIQEFPVVAAGLAVQLVLSLAFRSICRTKTLGAGDLKLLMVIRTFLSADAFLWVCFLGFLQGAIWGVWKQIEHKVIFGQDYVRRNFDVKTQPPGFGTEGIPLAVFFASGTLVYFFLNESGAVLWEMSLSFVTAKSIMGNI